MDSGADSYRRFLAGDDRGFVELVRDYKDGLLLYLNGFVHNLSVAEELTEDTFVKLGLKKPKDTGKASFKTWLYAIGRHTALDYLRKQKHRAEWPGEDPLQPESGETLEQAYLREESRQLLYQALRQLPSAYRQVLWLVYFEGFSHKEAARIMGKSVHGIDTLVWRARQSLKTVLIKEGFVYEDL